MNTQAILRAVLRQYDLPKFGLHGLTHWARVLENGRLLAGRNRAKIRIVELFAMLHDSRRQDEGGDFEHGGRAAAYVGSLQRDLLQLTDEDLHLLQTACALHTHGLTQADVTVQTCWDADRLDLGRTGTTPDPERLCTAGARDPALIARLDRKSRSGHMPRLVVREWSLPSLLVQTQGRKNTSEVLYHGSGTPNIKQLQPRRDSFPGREPQAPPAVYAGADPAYAAAHIFKGPKELFCEPVRSDKKGLVICRLEVRENHQDELRHRACIYLVQRDAFEYLPHVAPRGQNYRSLKPVQVLCEISYPDIRTAIEELGGVVSVIPSESNGAPE
jgi:uncharacterized protein